MSTIEAIVSDGVRTVLARRALPARPAGWARVRVLLAGICRTDVHAATGLLPLGGERVLGHELVGEIDDADAASAFRHGDRVTVRPLVPCGACARCVAGRRCASPKMLGVDLDGGFADALVVPEASLVRVPRELPLRRAAYVEPLAAATAVLRAPIRAGARGAVVGAGRIAELTLRVLRARGYAAEGVGARAFEGASFAYVVDAHGTDATLREALRLVEPGGVVVLKSRPAAPVALDVACAVRNDVTLAAVGYGDFDEAVALATELLVDDLLGDVYPLARFEAAMALLREQPLGPKVFLAPRHGG